MKKYSILLFCMLGLFIFSSCQEDQDNNPRYNDPTKFVLNTPKFAEGYYDLLNTKTLELTCSQADYGFAAAATYAVQVSTNATFEGFVEADQTLPQTYSLCKMDVDAKELDIAICRALKVVTENDMPKDPIPVYIRLKSSITGVESSVIYSNIITLKNVMPYYALPDVTLPTQMFMIGNFCAWDWASSAKMIAVNGTPDRFWTIRYVKAGEGFKFSTEKSWDGHNFALKNVTVKNNVAGEVKEVDGNIVIEKSGWYIFSVTTSIVGRDYHHTLDVLAPNVYVYGAANGGSWGNDPAWKFTVVDDPDAEYPFVSPTVLATTGADGDHCLRLCIHPEEWLGIDWWRTEFIYFGDMIEYRGNGGDQARIGNVAGKVYLNFVTGKAKCE